MALNDVWSMYFGQCVSRTLGVHKMPAPSTISLDKCHYSTDFVRPCVSVTFTLCHVFVTGECMIKSQAPQPCVQDYDLINFKRSSSAAFYEAATESAKTTTYCYGLEKFWVDIYVSHPPLTKGYVRREKIVFKQEEKADMTSAPHKFKRKCDKLIIGHILEHM